MKKVLAIALVLVMVFAFCAACSPAATPTPTAAPGTPTPAVWPNGEVTILAGYAVGSLTDINIHTIADWITKKTGVKVTIKNNDVGGGANLATELVNAKPDGQTIMLIGMNCISNYHSGTWKVNPADSTKFKICCGAIQPLPDSGCMILTQADSPYNTWEELAAYAKANPGKVTVASIAGKVMDTKMKALFNGTGVVNDIRWAPTNNQDAAAGLLGGTINCVMLDEVTAVGYLKDGKCKAIINSRYDEDFSLYDGKDYKDLIAAVPTLKDVFGEKGKEYMIPNRSMFVVPAGTPDDICAQIAAIVDAIDNEVDDPNDNNDFYSRCRVNGGTSKYYTWSGAEIMDEWGRLDSVLKAIVEMNKK